MLLSTPRPYKWSLSFRFADPKPVCDSCFPHSCHMPNPSFPNVYSSLVSGLVLSRFPTKLVWSRLVSSTRVTDWKWIFSHHICCWIYKYSFLFLYYLFMCGLLNDDVSESNHKSSNGKTLYEWRIGLHVRRRRRSWPYLTYHGDICV